jgi:hypothetical protein
MEYEASTQEEKHTHTLLINYGKLNSLGGQKPNHQTGLK